MKRNLTIILTVLALLFFPKVNFGQAPTLGTAANFELFTSVGAVGNTGISKITGNVGTNSGAITGFGNVNGVMHSGDGATGQCAADLLIAYNQLAAATPTFFPSPALGNGDTLVAGVYSISGATVLSSILTLNAEGNANAVFIFQIQGPLSANANSKVKLINGALACNVFWKIEGLVSIASGTFMKGTVIANNAAINMNAGDTLEGRALSTTGAVNVDGVLAYTPIGCGSPVLTGPSAPSLASAACYALFSSNGPVTNSGVSYVIGDVGTNVGLTTVFDSLYITGTLHPIPDGSTSACAADLGNVYTYLNTLTADIELLYPAQFGNNLVLTPHTYVMNAAATFTDTLYLNAQGDANAVFVIKIYGALTTSTYSKVNLINGTQAKNVYWLVNGAVGINDYSIFNGTIVANNGAIDLATGVTIHGRALTTTGALTTSSITAAMPPGCSSGSISISSAPINQTVCEGGIASFSVTAIGTGLTYQWRKGNVNLVNGGNISGATSATLTINPAIFSDISSSYNVIISASNAANDTSSNVSLSVNSNPSVTIANGPTAFCAGDSVSFDAGIQSSYLWSNGSTVEIINVATGGFYTVTVTNNSGCTSSAHRTATALIAPAPNIYASNLSNICNNGSGTLTVGATFTAYSWNTGATTQSISINSGGTYSVTITNTNGCTGTTSQVVNVNLSPNITPNGSTTFCTGGSVTLNAGSYSSYHWNTNATIESISTNTSGTYTVTVTNSLGCTGTTSQTVIVNSLPSATITANGSTSFCTGGSVTLDAGAGNSNYSWSNAETTRTINATSTGSFSVVVTNNYGCTASSSSIQVTVNTVPSLTLSGNLNACPGGNSTLAASGASTYTWSPSTGMNTTTGANVIIHLPSSSSITYTVIGTNGNCNSTMTFTATVGSPIFTTTYTNCVCNRDSSAIANISVTGGGLPYTYTLTNTLNNSVTQSSNYHIEGLIATRYRIQVTDAGGCLSALSYIMITQPSAVTYNYSKMNESCNGSTNGTITLNAGNGTAGISPNPRYYYTINANSGTPTFLPGSSNSSSYTFNSLALGTYYVRVKDANGCLSSTINTVTISQPTALTFTTVTIPSACGSSTGQIILYSSGGTGVYNFSKNGGTTWQSGYTFTALAPGTYAMIIKDANGCTSNVQNVTVGCNGARIAGSGSSTAFTFDVYPNPTHDRAIIEFQNTDVNSHVLIEFYGIAGDKLSTLFDSDIQQGVNYQAEINTVSLPSGIYLYRILCGDQIINKKLVVLK